MAKRFGRRQKRRLNKRVQELEKKLQEAEAVLREVVHVVCPACSGSGIIPKLYPSGHAEITCPNCEGEGAVEYSPSVA